MARGDTVPPKWFIYDTAVVLSILSSKVMSDLFFVKTYTAKNAARISRQFMWYSFSSGDQGPPVVVP